MSSRPPWQNGPVQREALGPILRPFAPAHAVPSLIAIDLDAQWESGKRLLLLDVDHTIVQWRTEEFDAGIVAWIERAKAIGFKICLVSNTRHPDRLERIRQKLGIEVVRGAFKPSRAMFRLALIKFRVRADQALMVGDQLMTDVLGANRSGIDAIWVQKMEGPEFKGTAINRFVERLLTGPIYRAMVSPVDESTRPEDVSATAALTDRPIFRQFLKFALVGGSSFVINYCITQTLMFAVPWQGGLLSETVGASIREALPRGLWYGKQNLDFFAPVAGAMGAGVAILNSFIWNRSWTFKIKGREGRSKQLRRFLVLSVTTNLAEIVLYSVLFQALPLDAKNASRLAKVVSSGSMAVANFLGQRLYAFRDKEG